MKAGRRSVQRCAVSRQFAGQARCTRWQSRRPRLADLTLALPASWAIIDLRETKGRGRPLRSFRVSFRRSHETSFEMSFEWSFQRSFDASFRRSFELSDAGSDALSFEVSDARSDEASSEMSDGRSCEVSFRVCFLRYFPTNSEASFPASFVGSDDDCDCGFRSPPAARSSACYSCKRVAGWPQRPLSDSAGHLRNRGSGPCRTRSSWAFAPRTPV